MEEDGGIRRMEGEMYTVLVDLDALATQPTVMAAAEALPSSQRTERRCVSPRERTASAMFVAAMIPDGTAILQS